MRFDVAGRQACALCYGRFLLHVDLHVPGGIDDQVLQWLLDTGQREVSALSTEAWDVLTFVLLYLVAHGALATTTILRGLVYPAWQIAATASSEQQGLASLNFLTAANKLFDQLLFGEDGMAPGVSPVDLLEVQRIRTLRQDVYREPHFSLLVAMIPTLVSIEKNLQIPQFLQQASSLLRVSLCQRSDFRQGVHRNLSAVREAFEQLLLSEAIAGDFSDLLANALRIILSDSPSGW